MIFSRLARPSSTQALRQVGFIGPLPTDLEEKIRAVFEMRPQRLEEHHNYNIVRWSVGVTVAAVAARVSGLAIGYGGITQDQADAIHVVTHVRNIASGSAVSVRVGALPAYANNTIFGVRALDDRATKQQGSVELFVGMIQGGDLAAVPGSFLDQIAAAPATGAADEVTPQMSFQQDATGHFLLLTNFTVNVSMNVAIRGYTVLPR